MNIAMCKQKDQNSWQAVHWTNSDKLTINLVKKYTCNAQHQQIILKKK